MNTNISPMQAFSALRCRFLACVDGSNPSATLDGATLMTTGIQVTLKGTNISELMFIKGTPLHQ